MSNKAWVTLATNDSYGLGALVLAHSLRRANSQYPAVVLITPSVTEAMRDRLRAVFAEVVLVDVLDSKDATHLALLQRPELGITFTKIHCWNLTQYEKCVFLDADTLVIQNCDELFEREELSAAPDVGWPDCFNSGVFVFTPSADTFSRLVTFAQERGSFDGGDQGLLNSFFSDWAHGDINKHLPFLYNVTSAAFYSYLPALKHYGQDLKIIHFIGAAKPWLQHFNFESRTVDAPDHIRGLLQAWWDLFVSQVHTQLDTSMVEVDEPPPRTPPPELPPQDVSQHHHYKPVLDPESEFPWHRPDSQIVEEPPEARIDMTDVHDPWEIYRGHIPPNPVEQSHSTSSKRENLDELRQYAWDYQHQISQQASTPAHDEHVTQEHWSPPSVHTTERYSHHHDIHQHSEPQHSDHYYQSHSDNHWSHVPHHESHDQQPSFHDQSTDHHLQWHHDDHSHSDNYATHHQYEGKHEQYYSHAHEQYNSHQYEQYHSETQEQYHSETGEQSSQSQDHQSQNFSHTHHHSDRYEGYQPHTNELYHSHEHTHYKDTDIHTHYHSHTQPYTQKQQEIEVRHVHVQPERNKKRRPRKLKIDYATETNGLLNGDVSDSDNEFYEEVIPRHPYDGFYLRHRVTIDSHGRKICSHEIPPTPSPLSTPPESPTPQDYATADENGASDIEDHSGVAGNLARVVPGASTHEALDDLTRRQGWEAGNIDYMGADSFDKIWAKISQTLSQPRTSPPKEASPPQEAQPVEVASEAVSESVEVPKEAAPVEAAQPVEVPAPAPVQQPTPAAAPEPVQAEVPTPVTPAPSQEAKKETAPAPVESSKVAEPVVSEPELTKTPAPEPAKTEVSDKKPMEPVKEAVPAVVAAAPKAEETPEVASGSPAAGDVPASEPAAPASATPEKAGTPAATDSPPLANTPSKEEAPAVPAAKSEERRKPAGKLQLVPPAAADPLPTPDSELEDAASLATAIIASELRTPTVSSPASPPVPASAPTDPQRLSVAEPEVPTPPVGAVSLAQIGVKPKEKPSTASLIESSVAAVAPASPDAPPSAPADTPKKKVVKKVVKKEGAGGEAPVPPPRKKEKKPKEK